MMYRPGCILTENGFNQALLALVATNIVAGQAAGGDGVDHVSETAPASRPTFFSTEEEPVNDDGN